MIIQLQLLSNPYHLINQNTPCLNILFIQPDDLVIHTYFDHLLSVLEHIEVAFEIQFTQFVTVISDL